MCKKRKRGGDSSLIIAMLHIFDESCLKVFSMSNIYGPANCLEEGQETETLTHYIIHVVPSVRGHSFLLPHVHDISQVRLRNKQHTLSRTNTERNATRSFHKYRAVSLICASGSALHSGYIVVNPPWPIIWVLSCCPESTSGSKPFMIAHLKCHPLISPTKLFCQFPKLIQTWVTDSQGKVEKVSEVILKPLSSWV